jgi:hypothetical protein
MTMPIWGDFGTACAGLAALAGFVLRGCGGAPPLGVAFGGRFFSSRSETGSAHCYHDGSTTTHGCRRKPCLATGDY